MAGSYRAIWPAFGFGLNVCVTTPYPAREPYREAMSGCSRAVAGQRTAGAGRAVLRSRLAAARGHPQAASATAAGIASAQPQKPSMTVTASPPGRAASRAGPGSSRATAAMAPR